LLQASDGEIRMTTTDMDVGVRRSVDAQVERTGVTTLARRLFSIVRELPSSEIYFDVDAKNFASIRSGSSYFKTLGLPEEEFSPLARFEDAKIFTIAGKERENSGGMEGGWSREVLTPSSGDELSNYLALLETISPSISESSHYHYVR
jgi:hypothetical protein